MTDHPNLDRMPRGQLEWRALINSVQLVDDRAERYFLELKSELDLTNKEHKAKVAKFILGAANRAPDRAKRRLEGFALMIIGVELGAARGIGPFEAKDLEASVNSYIGTDGPAWDFERISLDNGRDVIVIVAHPPTGQQLWTCLKDGPDNLRDGGIYIRGDGETRQAKGTEVRELASRIRQAVPDVELEVGIEGVVNAVSCSLEPFQEYAAVEAARLRSAVRVTDQPDYGGSIMAGVRVPQFYTDAFARSENRSRREYESEITKWVQQVEASRSKVVDRIAGALFDRSRVRIVNHSKRFLEDVQVNIHLEGLVRAVDVGSRDDDFLFDLPSTPRKWGPYQKFFGLPIEGSTYRGSSSWTPAPNAVEYRNGGSVDLTFTLANLRPIESYRTDDDEFLLVLEGAEESEVRGTWQVTARGINDVFSGDLIVPVTSVRSLTQAVTRLLTSNGNDDVSDLS